MPAALHQPMINCQSDRVALSARAAPLMQSVARTLRLWRSRMRERHAFPADLDDRQLHDLGLSRWEIERELKKPFWRG
jgi:uncharacterized protein YjiS (DUF1127 family)